MELSLSLTHIVAEFFSGHQINICLLFFRTGAVKSHFHSDKKKLQAGRNHCSDAALTNMNKLQLISLPIKSGDLCFLDCCLISVKNELPQITPELRRSRRVKNEKYATAEKNELWGFQQSHTAMREVLPCLCHDHLLHLVGTKELLVVLFSPNLITCNFTSKNQTCSRNKV